MSLLFASVNLSPHLAPILSLYISFRRAGYFYISWLANLNSHQHLTRVCYSCFQLYLDRIELGMYCCLGIFFLDVSFNQFQLPKYCWVKNQDLRDFFNSALWFDLLLLHHITYPFFLGGGGVTKLDSNVCNVFFPSPPCQHLFPAN